MSNKEKFQFVHGLVVSLLSPCMTSRAEASTTQVLILPKLINMNTLKTLNLSTLVLEY